MKNSSILIPVYNSEKSIVEMCNYLIQQFADEEHFQIVLVNDGSHDQSGEQCRLIHKTFPGIVTYVELARNFGEHNALMAGLHHVTGDYCIMMDDDFQNPPEEARTLTREIRKGYDVVYTRFPEKKDPLLRRLGSYFNDRVANIVLNKPVGLYLSSYKCINRFLIDEIIKYDGQNPYIDGIILRSTNRIGTVQVTHNPRKHGQSGYTLTKLVSLWSSMALNFSLIPLRFIGVAGCLLTICSFGYSLYRRFFDAPYDPLTNHEWLMTLLLFLVGLVLFSIALLAEYVGRMHLFLNKQPQYIVREVRHTNQQEVSE